MAGPVEVRPLAGRDDEKAFLELPYRLHAGHPHWVPPLRMAERELMDTGKNPFFEHAAMERYLAWRGDEVVGRVAAIDNARHNELHQDNVAFFGFFEAEDEPTAVALLDTAANWARRRGRDRLRGPANPSMNDTCGLLVEGFDEAPYLLMPYNRPEYPGWVEAAGFAKAKDLWAWDVELADHAFTERVERILGRIRDRIRPEPVIRPLNTRDYWTDAATMRRLFSAAWSENWGFVPPTPEEFHHAAREMRQILYPQMALFMEVEDVPIAFSVTLPDINQILATMGGRLRPLGILKLLLRRRFTDQGRMLLLGVDPAWRNKGLELVLIAESIAYARDVLGWQRGECSWTLEDNAGVNKAIEAIGGVHYKTYRMYDKPLA